MHTPQAFAQGGRWKEKGGQGRRFNSIDQTQVVIVGFRGFLDGPCLGRGERVSRRRSRRQGSSRCCGLLSLQGGLLEGLPYGLRNNNSNVKHNAADKNAATQSLTRKNILDQRTLSPKPGFPFFCVSHCRISFFFFSSHPSVSAVYACKKEKTKDEGATTNDYCSPGQHERCQHRMVVRYPVP